MTERKRIQGIVWNYPILNAILEAVERWRQRIRERWQQRPAQSSSLRTTVKNVEKLEWTDYKGRKRNLVIEREVKTD